MPLVDFTLAPTPRCYYRGENAPREICGRPAICMAPATAVNVAAFFCALHRRADSVPIAATTPYRRVRLTIEILLGGASASPEAAHSEAVAWLERVVEARGGWLDVRAVTSEIGCPGRSAIRRVATVGQEGV